MRVDAIQPNKQPKKPKKSQPKREGPPKRKGRRSKIDTPSFWSGNTALILWRLDRALAKIEEEEED